MLKHVTPAIAKELLARRGLRAGRRYGQHFLVDPNTVRRIVRLAEIGPDETILEIGPGLGSLTVALAEAAERVVAVEVDPEVADALAEVLEDAPNVDVVIADALRAEPGEVLPARARLVANLPYNIATPLLLRLLDDVPQMVGGLVMVQRELGERWTAAPGSRVYGAPTIHIDYHADARIVGDVPRTVFLPPPNVDSVLVAFDRRTKPAVHVDDPRAFFAFVNAAFGHRRKTVRNSLVASGLERGVVERALAASSVEPRSRPEQLTLDEFARMHAAVRDAA